MELLRWCRLQWDRVLAAAAMAGGVVALVLGWAGAAGTEYVAKQIPYAVSGGLGCLGLLMVGGTLWLSADFRDEWRALDRLEDRLREQVDGDPLLEELGRRLEELELGASRAHPRDTGPTAVLSAAARPANGPAGPAGSLGPTSSGSDGGEQR